MTFQKIDVTNALAAAAACQALKKNLAVIPTDTLYALCANACSDDGVAKIYAAKNREPLKALPIFVRDIAHAQEFAVFSEKALELAKRYWPGALTIVLPLKQQHALSSLLCKDKNSIAVRVPDSKFIIDLITQIDAPITATSANISGQANSLNIDDIIEDLKLHVNVFIEGQDIINNPLIPSTIVDCTTQEMKIIRAGAIDLL